MGDQVGEVETWLALRDLLRKQVITFILERSENPECQSSWLICGEYDSGD